MFSCLNRQKPELVVEQFDFHCGLSQCKALAKHLLLHFATEIQRVEVAMGHNLWLHFGVDEHSFATYFDVHLGFPGF